MDPITAGASTLGILQTVENITNAMRLGGNAIKQYGEFVGDSNIIKLSQSTRINARTYMDQRCTSIDGIDDVLQSVLSLYTGFFMQAVDSMSTINSVTVGQKLAPFNPNRAAAIEHYTTNPGAYTNGLPMTAVGLEAAGAPSNKDTNKLFTDAANMSVGKVIEVCFGDGAQRVSMNVFVRLMVKLVASTSIVNMLSLNTREETDLYERFQLYRADAIDLADLLTGRDIIAKRKKHILQDKSGAYKEILQKNIKNVSAGLLSGKASVNNASNIMITTSDAMNAIEANMGGSMDSSRFRQTLFDESFMLILAVVDPGDMRARFYYNGMEEYTDVSLRSLKTAAAKSPDIMDFLKAYKDGAAPSF